MMLNLFGLPFGVWIRLAFAAVIIGVAIYGKHLYDDHIRAPLKLEYETKVKAADQRTADAVAINDTLRRSLDQTEGRIKAANLEIDRIAKEGEARAKDASDRATAAIAKAQAGSKATLAKADEMRKFAAQANVPDDIKEADRILTGYAQDMARIREVLGLNK